MPTGIPPAPTHPLRRLSPLPIAIKVNGKKVQLHRADGSVRTITGHSLDSAVWLWLSMCRCGRCDACIAGKAYMDTPNT